MSTSLVLRRVSMVALAAIGATMGATAGCGSRGDSSKSSRTALRAPAIGAVAPVYAAHTLDDSTVTLAAFHGRVVVLNVWATWCQPCKEELPQLQALHQQFATQEVSMIGVSVDAAGSGSDVREFAKEHGLTYPIWLDPDHDFALKFLTIGVPETFVVDRAGVIRWRKIGALARGDTTLSAAIRAALGS